MAEKSSFLEYFDNQNMGTAFEDAAEIKREMASGLLVLLQLREQLEAKVITKKFVQSDLGMMKLYFTLRKNTTDVCVIENSMLGFFLRLSLQLELNEAEKMVLFAGLFQEDDRIASAHWSRLTNYPGNKDSSLAAVQKLYAFAADMEEKKQEMARAEKLALLLRSEAPLKLCEILRIYAGGKPWGKRPDGITGVYCSRVLTGESDPLEELVLYGDILRQIKNMAAKNKGDWTLFLRGEKGTGKQLIASYLAKGLKRNLLVLDGTRLRDYKRETALYLGESNSKYWYREWLLQVLLSGDIVYLKNADASDIRLIRASVKGILIVANDSSYHEEESGEEKVVFHDMVTIEFKTPTTDEKVILWKSFLRRFFCDESLDPYVLGSKYVLNAGQILEILFAAQSCAAGAKREKIISSDITWAIAQSQSKGLGKFARPVTCVFDWDDLIVEDYVRKQMEYICAQMKYRHLVGSEWGFFDKMPYGRGLSVLFYGPPGTGKTMAAQVIAKELGLDLYRIDLSQMVSKYIGETEKNISMLFEKARHMNVILFFDEADAFFSKRSEVKDSNDRNANAEVAHLLQEMESYEGITILATNMKDNMDDAFKRRIKFMLNFSFPTVQTRIQLWHSLLPERTPRQENLALDFFAENFELSGSQIKDVLLMAAFMAASQNCVLGNEQIKEALRINYQKYGKILTESDFGYLV